MRFLLVLTILYLAAPSASAQGISDGRSLTQSCEALRAATAGGAKAATNDPCRMWLFNFFSAYKEDYDARMAAYLSGMSVDRTSGPCFRPPDFISFVDVAGLVVAQAKIRPDLLDTPAEAIVLEAMAAAYPCEAAGDAAQP
jgi:hypothetical protein